MVCVAVGTDLSTIGTIGRSGDPLGSLRAFRGLCTGDRSSDQLSMAPVHKCYLAAFSKELGHCLPVPQEETPMLTRMLPCGHSQACLDAHCLAGMHRLP